MTWSRVILDPFHTILSHVAADLQPMIGTSLMTLSLNSSLYSWSSTRLYTLVIHLLSGMFPCLRSVHSSMIETILLDLGLSSFSKSSQYVSRRYHEEICYSSLMVSYLFFMIELEFAPLQTMSKGLSKVGSHMNWTKDNKIYKRYLRWKSCAEDIFFSMLCKESEAEKCAYLHIWMGDNGYPFLKCMML